jgi:hypothetical protein
MASKVLIIVVALAVLVSGCTTSEEEIGGEADRTVDTSDRSGNETQNMTSTPVERLSDSNRLRLAGPGPAEFTFRTNESFTVDHVSYHNPDGASVNGLEYWILLAPFLSDHSGLESCSVDPPNILLWHNALNGSNVFWDDQPSDVYTLVYDTPAGTWLEIEIHEDHSPGQESPSTENMTTYPSDYDAVSLNPDEVESESTGLGVHGSAVLELEGGNASMVYSSFAMSGLHLGPRSIEARFIDDRGTVCRKATDSANAFGLDVQLSTFMPANTTLQWEGFYEAEAGFNSNPQATVVRVDLRP